MSDEIFDPQEMRERIDRLKKSGKMPTLSEVVAALKRATSGEAPSAGECGEPSYTTPAGFPICSECGKSTRNRNALVCAPCRMFPLTDEDRQWLQQIGVKR